MCFVFFADLFVTMADQNDRGKRPFTWDIDAPEEDETPPIVDPTSQTGSNPSSSSKGKKLKAHEKNVDWPPPQYTNFIRDVTLEWFRVRSIEMLTNEYVGKKVHGLEKLREEFYREFTTKLELDEQCNDVSSSYFQYHDWLKQQIDTACYNVTNMFDARIKKPKDGDFEQDVMEFRAKLQWFKGEMSQYSRSKTKTLPWHEKALKAAMEQHMGGGVVWIPESARVVPMSEWSKEGGHGKVRKVRIDRMDSIPNHIFFAAKESKSKDLKESRIARSVEALVCPLSHPGIIKFWAIHSRTMEAYTLWWNGDSLNKVLHMNTLVGEAMPNEQVLNYQGQPMEVCQRIAAYRTNRAKLAWALIYLVDRLHKSKVLHNDLSPYNILFHFPEDKPMEVYIGICDWGIASRTWENAPSLFGYDSKEKMEHEAKPRWWVAPELFYVFGPRNSDTCLERMQREHLFSKEGDAYSVGRLATVIFKDEPDKDLFKIDYAKDFFTDKLKLLCQKDVKKRASLAWVVEQLMSPPYNFKPPEMCYRRKI